MSAGTRPQRGGAPQTPSVHQAPVTESPFVALLSVSHDDAFRRDYRAPSLAGRSRPIGGLQGQADPFIGRYTTRASHAIPLRTPAVGA